ncbi:MAG: hypothetical protein R6U17_09925 [Thermoplasmata archaeon]
MQSVTNLFKKWISPEGKVKGSPVYLQENGELLGSITRKEDTFYIVDCRGVELRFSAGDLIEGEGGYIYKPPWYGGAKDVLASLEARRATDPELYDSTHPDFILDEDLKSLVEQAKRTTAKLLKKRSSMEKQVKDMETKISHLSKRKPGEIGRREYAKKIVDLNRRLNIIEINISRIDDLISKFERIPFIDVNTIEYIPNMNTEESKETMAERRSAEGERIKKIRILKLEKNLAEKQIQVAEGYIKDRLKRINGDIDDLKSMARENKDNEKVFIFLKNRLKDLRKEKKELQEKMTNIKHTNVDDVESDQELPKVVETEQEGEPALEGVDVSLITRVGSLIFIIGLIIVLMMSLLGIL